MTSQEISNSTPYPSQETPAADADRLQDTLSGEVIIEGTVITSATNTQVEPIITSSQVRGLTTTPGTVRPTLAQFILGSALVLSDEMGERIVVEQSRVPGTTRTPDSVYMPVSDFEQMLGGEQYRRTRYLALGVAEDTLKAAERGIGWVGDTADSAGKFVWRFADPVWNSALLGPIRNPFDRWHDRGEKQVQTWINNGMAQEQRSRVLATASLNNLVQESVTDFTNSPDVQDLVQEVIQSQSISMVTVVLQEVRERLISLDIWAQGIFGTAMPAPLPTREAYLHQLAVRRPHHTYTELSNSMAGYTAGFVTRLAAFSIDLVLLLLTYSLVSAALTGTLQLFGIMDLVSRFLTSGSVLANLTLGLVAISSLLLISGYNVLCWYFTGETLGDSIMGIQVVDLAGGRLSFWRAVRRMIGFIVAFIPLLLGFIWVLFDKQRRGWHDGIGGTFVTYAWPAHPEEQFFSHNVAEAMASDARKNTSASAR